MLKLVWYLICRLIEYAVCLVLSLSRREQQGGGDQWPEHQHISIPCDFAELRSVGRRRL